MLIWPDTQKLASDYPELLRQSADWIAEHAAAFGLRMVLHLGDVVDQGACEEEQYRRAADAVARVEDAGVPVLIVPGNHDYDTPIVSTSGPIPAKERRQLRMFNRFFGVRRLTGKSWFGGVFEEGRVENMYALWRAERQRLLVLMLEFMPRREVLAWADEVVSRCEGHDVIVVTHSYLNMYGERVAAGDPANPKAKYPSVAEGLDGEEMWQLHLKWYPRLRAVFSGHHMPETVSHRIDLGEHGNPVLQCFQNWQSCERGGEGRFRIFEWDPDERHIRSRVFNPVTERFEFADGYEVELRY